MKKSQLVVDLHLRLSEEFSNEINKIADENSLKPSQLARIVLQRTISQYSRDGMWG